MYEFDCAGAQVKTGFCTGAAHIKCCPSGEKGVKPTTNPANTPPPTPPPATGKDACLYGQRGTCIDTNVLDCRGDSVKSGFCKGATHIKCCPSSETETRKTTQQPKDTPPPSPPPSKDACLYGQRGACIDTNVFDCKGASTKTGFCTGAAHIKCCPSGAKNAKVTPSPPSNGNGNSNGNEGNGSNKAALATSPAPGPTPSPPARSDGCMYGQSGACIDTNQFDCKGAQVKTGFCTGAAHIKCCPSGEKDAKSTPAPGATDEGSKVFTKAPARADGRRSCLYGQSGFCVDTGVEECVGATVKTGFCTGSSSWKCCPSSVAKDIGVAKGSSPTQPVGADGGVATQSVTASTRTPYPDAPQREECAKGQAGFCINTKAYTCEGAGVLTGFCAGASHIKCCPSSDASAIVGYEGQEAGNDGAASIKNFIGDDDDAGAVKGTDAGAACNKGLAGQCVNVYVHAFGPIILTPCPYDPIKLAPTCTPTPLVPNISPCDRPQPWAYGLNPHFLFCEGSFGYQVSCSIQLP